jgi:drug/metabolite transporter (DMT)-like permease
MCLFYYACILQTSAAVSAILLYTAPIFVMIMSVIFFKEKVTVKKVFALALAVVGCALVSGILTGMTVNAVGIVFGILSGFAYSLYGILTAFFMRKNSEPLTFSALSFTFAAIGALLICDTPTIIATVAAQSGIPLLLGSFVLFSLCSAVIPFALYTKGLVGVRPDVASILAFAEPLTAALIGIFVLSQPFYVYQGVGIAFIVVAIIILNVHPKKKKK